MLRSRVGIFKQSIRQCYLFALVAASLLLAVWLVVAAPVVSATSLPDAPVARGVNHTPLAQDFTWSPFLDIVPSEDGSSVYVSAGSVVELNGNVTLHMPTHDKDSWTMTYSNTVDSYVSVATGFTPGTSEDAPLRITSSLGHDTGLVGLQRIHIPASTPRTINSLDGHLELKLIDPETLPYETYVAVVPSFGPPAPPPPAHSFVGSLYSIRAAGALVAAEKPMLLRLYFTVEMLRGADPHTLAIFAWDAANKKWQNLGGQLFADHQYLSVSTKRFTTFALFATNTWRDDFDDISGLDLETGFDNVTLGDTAEGRALVLVQTPGTGIATSTAIHLPPGMLWDSIEFVGSVDTPALTVRVDVLAEDGDVLFEDVESGTSLEGIDSETHERLRLRVRMASSQAGVSPALAEWGVSWQERPRLFLPVVQN